MISDRVAAVIPERSAFLRGYVEYASQCSDAPDIFHIGVGLTIFSAAVAKTARCPFMAGRQLVPNLYTLIVGPSRSARKTASLDIGIEILRRANPEAVIPIPGSYEELVAQLRATPTGLLEYREFGHFLKTTVRGYGEPIRTVLMDLFDWPPDQAYVRNLKKGKTVIEAPIVLSMLSAIATDLLFRFCVDEETEMLTASGWKHHKDVSVGELCYTLNHETGLGEWQPVSAINVFPGDPNGEMILMEGRGHSSLSTPNHRWPVRNKGNSTWGRRWRTSETLNQSDYIQCAALDGGLPKDPKWSDAFVELVAWLWTEGSWNVSNALSLSQSTRVNPDHCKRIRTALYEHLGPRCEGSMFPHRHSATPLWVEDPVDGDGQIYWRLNQEAARVFTEVLSIPEKVVSHAWLRTLTLQQLELFIETSFIADGDISKRRLAQTSKGRAESFAFACILAGKPVSYVTIDNDHNKQYEVGVVRRYQFSPIQNAENNDNRPSKIERVRYDGPVWCPTTPNGTWMARRKGSVYWTGNTDTEEWTGGFFGRCLLLYGERDTFKMPTPWDEAKDYLTGQLKAWSNVSIPYCGGFHPDAWSQFTQWSQYRDSSSANAPPRVQTFFSGATTLAAKIALLFAIDQHEPAVGHGWMISYASLAKAITFVDTLYLPSIMHLGARLALGPFERDRQRVLDAIEAKRTPIGRAELLRQLKISTQLMDQVIDTLRDSGEITAGQDARGITYKKTPEGVVIPLFPNGGGAQGSGTMGEVG